MRILVTSLLAVAGLHAQATSCEESANLQSIYEADQGDRETYRIDWGQVGSTDRVRRERVAEVLEVADKLCPVDLYRAAMVY